MSLRGVRALVAVADHGGFGLAASALGLTPAAVGLRIRELEAALRVELFDRVGRSAVLNRAGQAAVARAREILALYESLADVAAGPGLAGSLVLGVVPTTLTGIVPEALARLAREHPRVQTRLMVGLSADLAAKVEHGELDAALVSEPPFRLAAGLAWRECARERLVAIGPPDARESGARDMLVGHRFIRFNPRAWAGRLIDRALRARGIAVSTAMELDSLEAIHLMVSKGLGASVVPLRPGAFVAPVKQLPLDGAPVYRALGLVTRKAATAPLPDALLEALRRVGALATTSTGAAPPAPRRRSPAASPKAAG